MADFTTLQAVKSYAGVKASGDDAHIAGIVAAVSALIAGQIGHAFEGDTITAERHAPPFSGDVLLEKPAESITAVRVSGTTLSASTYRLKGTKLVSRLSGGEVIGWTSGLGIEVDYVTLSSVPADLELAAREICAFVVKQSSIDGGGSRLGLSAQANADTGSADYFTQALKALPVARMALRNHRGFA